MKPWRENAPFGVKFSIAANWISFGIAAILIRLPDLGYAYSPKQGILTIFEAIPAWCLYLQLAISILLLFANFGLSFLEKASRIGEAVGSPLLFFSFLYCAVRLELHLQDPPPPLIHFVLSLVGSFANMGVVYFMLVDNETTEAFRKWPGKL